MNLERRRREWRKKNKEILEMISIFDGFAISLCKHSQAIYLIFYKLTDKFVFEHTHTHTDASPVTKSINFKIKLGRRRRRFLIALLSKTCLIIGILKAE